MEATGEFSYAEYCRVRQSGKAPSIVTASSEADNEKAEGTEEPEEVEEAEEEEEEDDNDGDDDDDNSHTYIAMRDPDPAKDAQLVAIPYYYPQYAYTYPAQQVPLQVGQKEIEHASYHVHTKTKSPKLAAPEPAVQQPVMAYAAQTYSYPAYAYGYTMPTGPVPVHPDGKTASSSAKPASSSAKPAAKVTASAHAAVASHASGKQKMSGAFIGRTKRQVDEDNLKIAEHEGINKANDIVPKDAKPDQLFWVVETDGTNTLRTFQSINGGVLGNGKWRIDPRHGNAYFVREKEEKKEKK